MSNTNLYEKWYNTKVGWEIIRQKYFHEGETSFEEFANRVSGISQTQPSFLRNAMENADFFLAGRSLYSAGSVGKFKSSFSNCYIMPMPEDNIESIFDVVKESARIFSYGGGVGINLSKLRPSGAKVGNAARTSTGACSFMEIYNSAANVIGANNRRAALILGLNCSHPDIEEFLEIKKNNTAIQSANISILFNDEFMRAVEYDEEYLLNFKVESTGEFIAKNIKAREFFMKFAEANWDWAEPGCLFIDTIRNGNLLMGYEKEEYCIDISNPCAEYLGNAYNSCNLGSINLYNFVTNPFTPEADVNWDYLAAMVQSGVETLDEVLDMGYASQPLEANRKAIDDWRAIGLGVFGLADMLIALGIRYGSEKSIHFIDVLMRVIFSNALTSSCRLAKEKGTFGKYDWDKINQSPLIQRFATTDLYKDIEQYGLRNASLLSIAPTGTIATMCGISGGVEPLFAISYDRTTHALEKKGQTFKVFAKSVEHLLRSKGVNPNQVTEEDIRKAFPFVVTTHDILPKDRIRVQAKMQEWVDNAISSTVNLSNDATVQDVFDVYVEAWRSGCKGITVFRDGCERTSILKSHTETNEPVPEPKMKLNYIRPIKRKGIGKVNGSTTRKSTACVPGMYVTVNKKDGDILEVFTNVSQGCTSNIGSITRLASLALRSGVKVEEIVKEMKSNHCQACAVVKSKGQDVSNSCSYAIAEVIEEAYKDYGQEEAWNEPEPNGETRYDYKGVTTEELNSTAKGLILCPECGERTLRPEGRCFTCTNCLYSKCE